MLLNLHVKNLALLDEVEVDFFDHLNILTGETGAGKSFLIGSIQAALGGRVSRDLIRAGADYALIELQFHIESEKLAEELESRDIFPENDLLTISRRIMEKRSVCRINGETVPLSRLKEISELLINLHGQQESMTLKNPARQLEIVDQYAGSQAQELLQKVRESYKEYESLDKEYQDLVSHGDERLRQLDFLQYEVKEIDDAALTPGEDERLEADFKKMSNSQQIMEALSAADQIISGGQGQGLSDLMSECIRSLVPVEDIDDTLGSFGHRMNQIDGELSDLHREIKDYMESMEFDQSEFRDISDRLDVINSLKKKYGSSIGQILEYADSKRSEIDRYSDMEEYRSQLEKKRNEAESRLTELCDRLGALRRKSAAKLSNAITSELLDLNFLQVNFQIVCEKTEPTAHGSDSVRFMISTNPGLPLRPMEEVASGGELSRIMLAVKSVMADTDDCDTLVFDEIDSGVSGRTAQKVAEKLNLISRRHQVICITHLPQIAAMADTHFSIEKVADIAGTRTVIRMLNDKESVEELARLLGGAEITDKARENAREMKAQAREKKENR